jgi:hypothetical protein
MADTDTSQLPSVDMTQDPLGKPEGPHPYRQDLDPDSLEGENYGTRGPHPEKAAGHTAYDVKDVHRALDGWEDDDLRQIPIMPTGSRLEQGATYINLSEDEPSEFVAWGDMTAGPEDRFVPKSEVPYPLWNRLIGVQDPERLDQE